MNKIPCATCPEICENAIGLYKAYHLVKEYAKTNKADIKSMGLQCHKTGLYIELDLKQEMSK